MAKKRRRRASDKRNAVSKPVVVVSNDDLAVAQKITRYHTQIILLACIPQLFLFLNREWMEERTGDFTKWVLILLMFFGFIGIYLNYRYPITIPYKGNQKRVRQRAVFLLATAIFINLMNWLPIVYAFGYFDLLNQTLGKEQIGAKLLFAIAFGLGAIVSGFLAKLTYEVVKVTGAESLNPHLLRKGGSRYSSRSPTFSTTPRIITPRSAQDDLLVARRISKINQTIVLLGIFPYSYPVVDFLGKRHLLEGDAVYVLLACTFINPFLMYAAARLSRYSDGIFNDPKPAVDNARKYRRLGKWQMTLGIIINIVACVPILYAEGYFSKWAKRLPAADVLGQKLSFGIIFLVSAIVAGILGNFVYDMLRFVLKRLIGR